MGPSQTNISAPSKIQRMLNGDYGMVPKRRKKS